MPKRLIMCCDGTWNTAGQRNTTNVKHYYDMLKRAQDAGSDQQAHYHAGVGTHWYDKYSGGAFGVGLSGIVQDAYRVIVRNWTPGNELYLLGFSRGAYTARSVAGLIRNAGILRPEHVDRIGDAYALYRTNAGPDADEAVDFRRKYAYSDQTPIRFIGVWDTVGALGIPDIGVPGFSTLNKREAFHDVTLSSRVGSAYHALAVHEAREAFLPTLWKPKTGVEGQTVEQVWFTGVHCDVGGGYAERELANITLHWMIQKGAECGLEFGDRTDLGEGDPMGTKHESRTKFYKLVHAVVRDVGSTDEGHEYSSSSAKERINNRGDGTTALRDYVDRPGQIMDVDGG
jgi:uncharacterized protein (DUF2235 family)